MPTPDERYAANMQHLHSRDPHMAAQLAALPLTNLQLFPSASGALTGAIWDVRQQGWVSLTAPDDPVAEAVRDAEQLYHAAARVHFLAGFGLGYFSAAFVAKMQPWQRMAIVETVPQLFKAALYCIDLEPFLTRNIHFILGDNAHQAIEQWFLSFSIEDKLAMGALMRGGYTAAFQRAEHDALNEYTAEFVRYHLIGLATWEQFGPDIGRNDLANLPEFFTVPGYNRLKDIWQGKPAVCIAAGPSLRKNLHFLCDPIFRSRVCVITVGTCYALLKALGITPDIVTTIDFQRLNWTDQFQHIPLEADVPLVYLHSTYCQTVRRWPGPRFVAVSGSDTTEYLRQYLLEEKAGAERTQTVAHLNLLVAYMIGANPIILLGQDLAHTETEHHAIGARAQDSTVAEAQESYFQVPGYDGQSVWTRHSYASMRTVFQQLIASRPQQKVINCTEGGVSIAGAPNMPLQEMVEEIALLHVPAGPTVREQAQQIARTYVPHYKHDELDAHLQQMTAHAEVIAQWCADMQTLGVRYDAATTEEERLTIAQEVLATEPRLNAYRPATSLYCIRSFPSVRLMAEIPLDAQGHLRQGDDLIHYNMQRMRTLAELFAPLHAGIVRDLRLARRRLAGMTLEQSDAQWHRLVALQCYETVQQLLTTTAIQYGWKPQDITLAATVTAAQQRYETALALTQYTQGTSRKVARWRQRQQAFAATVPALQQAYLPLSQKDDDHAEACVPEAPEYCP